MNGNRDGLGCHVTTFSVPLSTPTFNPIHRLSTLLHPISTHPEPIWDATSPLAALEPTATAARVPKATAAGGEVATAAGGGVAAAAISTLLLVFFSLFWVPRTRVRMFVRVFYPFFLSNDGRRQLLLLPFPPSFRSLCSSSPEHAYECSYACSFLFFWPRW